MLEIGLENGVRYLEHESLTLKLGGGEAGVEGREIKVFASPYSPAHGLWAFSYEEDQARELWDQIPGDTDILITHTPPKGHCDKTTKDGRVGCEALLRRLGVVKPRLHVCGHIHEGRGAELITWREDGGEKSVRYWDDPGLGLGNRKMSKLSLLEGKPSKWYSTKVARSKARATDHRLQRSNGSTCPGHEVDRDHMSGDGSSTGNESSEDESSYASKTCVVNAAIMQNSWPGPRTLNKPIVVDMEWPSRSTRSAGAGDT